MGRKESGAGCRGEGALSSCLRCQGQDHGLPHRRFMSGARSGIQGLLFRGRAVLIVQLGRYIDGRKDVSQVRLTPRSWSQSLTRKVGFA